MLFNTYRFIFAFFPIVFFISKKIPRFLLLPWIVFSSYLFYISAGHVWFLIPMLFTTIYDYFAVIIMANSQDQAKRKFILTTSLIINLGMLFFFKYSFFMVDSLWSIMTWSNPQLTNMPEVFNFFKVTLPAGISFYTFQTISYSVDVYRGHAHAEKNFWRFAGFVSFFPHLVAGPITRHNQLIPQLDQIRINGIKSRYEEGIYLFSLGLAKKILIADQIALIINPLLEETLALNILNSWMVLIGFTFQLYFDFSGYSDMAIGLARLFGIELPQNFNAPYRALNPSDFWKRWHISLSAWLRDYLYISLGGNRKRRFTNLFITMLLGGLWHGANWTYVIWGAYHGIILIVYHKTSKSWDKLNLFIQRALTFILVTIGWFFFRAKDWNHIKQWSSTLVDIHTIQNFVFNSDAKKLSFLLAISLIIVNHLPVASTYNFINLKKRWQVILAFLLVLSLLLMNNGTSFLYYQF